MKKIEHSVVIYGTELTQQERKLRIIRPVSLIFRPRNKWPFLTLSFKCPKNYQIVLKVLVGKRVITPLKNNISESTNPRINHAFHVDFLFKTVEKFQGGYGTFTN